MSTSRKGDSATSLGSRFQCLTILTAKRFFFSDVQPEPALVQLRPFPPALGKHGPACTTRESGTLQIRLRYTAAPQRLPSSFSTRGRNQENPPGGPGSHWRPHRRRFRPAAPLAYRRSFPFQGKRGISTKLRALRRCRGRHRCPPRPGLPHCGSHAESGFSSGKARRPAAPSPAAPAGRSPGRCSGALAS